MKHQVQHKSNASERRIDIYSIYICNCYKNETNDILKTEENKTKVNKGNKSEQSKNFMLSQSRKHRSLKKNQNVPRPSEHPPVRGKKCQNV